jgi:DNA-binding transcriptional ArsR family regulator
MFKTLAVDTRIKIIELLKSRGPLGAKKISELIGVTPAAVSQHLRILRQAGLVKGERKGYWIPYSIDEEAMDCCRQVLDEVCTCGCGKTNRGKEKELKESNLKSLKKYEKKLRNELKMIRKSINEIESQKK